MQPTELIHSPHLPQQTLKKLSFCESNKPQKLSLWISQLRITQIMPTAIILYRYIPEINQLKCDARTRFTMLELLYPITQDIICSLTKTFLNQPVTLPEEAKKTALIAQALQKTLIDGYLLCLRDVISKNHIASKRSAFFNLALHRAITGIGHLFLRCYQLRIGTPQGLWHQLHRLFVTADIYNLLHITVEDPTVQHQTTIEAAYSRVLILALSRPNQLGQKDIQAVSHSAESWSSHLKYHRVLTDNTTNFFCVDLESDNAPEKKIAIPIEKKHILELDFTALLHEIEKRQHQTGLSTVLRHHVMNCWSRTPERSQERRNTKDVADMCIGLRDLHQAVSNYDNLDNLIEQSSHEEKLSDTGINKPFLNHSASQNTVKTEIQYHEVSIQNFSSGGYCIVWPSDVQVKFDSGEIIGIRDNHHTWVCCVIRWIRQCKQGAQLGIQILSDNPQAYGAAQIYDTGGHADYTRALYLPASDTNDMQATLITATTPFQELQQIKVVEGKKEQTWLLQQLLFATRSLQQFTFKEMD